MMWFVLWINCMKQPNRHRIQSSRRKSLAFLRMLCDERNRSPLACGSDGAARLLLHLLKGRLQQVLFSSRSDANPATQCKLRGRSRVSIVGYMDFRVAERRQVQSHTVDCSSGSISHKGKIFCGSRDRDSLRSRDLLNAKLTKGGRKEIVEDQQDAICQCAQDAR